jgi:hypothetical protein
MNRLTAEHFEAITDIPQRRLAFANYIKRYYNTNNRSVMMGEGEDSSCIYSASENSPGCAIGQFLTKEAAAKLDGNSPTYGMNVQAVLTKDELKDCIPGWMEEMGSDFLNACQRLHDSPDNWDDNGLSARGEQWFEEYILTRFLRHVKEN